MVELSEDEVVLQFVSWLTVCHCVLDIDFCSCYQPLVSGPDVVINFDTSVTLLTSV